MEPTKEIVNWQRLIITTLLVVVAASLTSSITWFILDRTFEESQQTNDKVVNDLEKKITYLSKRIDTGAPITTGVEQGQISGTISYPSSGIPVKTKIFVEDTKTGKVYEAEVTFVPGTSSDMAASATYSVLVPDGSYYVYGTLEGFNDQNGTPWKAYYNQFVVCGMAANCKDTSKVVVTVESSKFVENITIGDWYPTK